MTKEGILKAAGVDTAPKLEVDAIGGEALYVRRMTGTERDSYQNATIREDDDGDTIPQYWRGHLVVRCLCGADGVRVFDDADAEQVNGLDNAVLQGWFDKAMEVNTLRREDREAAEKN